MAAKSFILQEGAQPFPSVPVWTEPIQLLTGVQPSISELLLRRFQAILFITNYALRVLLAAILAGSRQRGRRTNLFSRDDAFIPIGIPFDRGKPWQG